MGRDGQFGQPGPDPARSITREGGGLGQASGRWSCRDNLAAGAIQTKRDPSGATVDPQTYHRAGYLQPVAVMQGGAQETHQTESRALIRFRETKT
jgi:hypothetical protein